jgi:glycosyltransferase involved in cell wall biosynthesis
MSAADVTAPLRVVLVTKHARGGGAERIASSLHRGLAERGHHAWLATAKGDPDDPSILRIPRGRPPGGMPGRLLRRTARAVGARGGGRAPARTLEGWLRNASDPKGWMHNRLGHEPMRFPGTARIPTLAPEPPDLIHCHNLHGAYFDLRQLAPMSRRLPVALTLHDEWTFTGHCAYTLGCERWRTGCGSCPDLAVYPAIRRDATHANWQTKRDIYVRSRLYVTTPSQWLTDRAKVSILAEGVRSWRTIPNGVDLSVFTPANQADARRRLDLPLEPFIVLFTANQARRSPFKDWATVSEAAERAASLVAGRRVLCLALGDEGPSRQFANGELRFVPYRSEMGDVAAFYQAADLYLHAAKADNLPTTILEALATGLPVVATAIGGIPEEVRSLAGAAGAWPGAAVGPDAATGVLVGAADAQGMGSAAASLLGDDALRRRLGRNAVADAAARFDIDRQVDATLAWYREIIEDWRQARPAAKG